MKKIHVHLENEEFIFDADAVQPGHCEGAFTAICTVEEKTETNGHSFWTNRPKTYTYSKYTPIAYFRTRLITRIEIK